MNNIASSPPRSLAWRLTAVALAAVVVIAAVALVVTLTSSTPLPVLAASYKCVPGQLIPQLKPGQSTTLTTSYGGFTASFHSRVQKASNIYPSVGVPLAGSLTMTGGGQRWTLPRPDVTKESTIDAMCVIAFQRQVHPGVMIEGFTGGAHCCEVPVIYLYDQSLGRYTKVVDMSPKNYKDPHAFDENEGFIPRVVGSQVLLQTGDGQFDYAFGCYACGEDPIVLDAAGLDGLTDVTPQHPALVAADARSIWKYVASTVKAESGSSQTEAPFGFVAPWAADECVLGRGATAWSTVEQLQRQGKLSDALYYQATLNHGSFVARLHSFLLRNDYCTGQI